MFEQLALNPGFKNESSIQKNVKWEDPQLNKHSEQSTTTVDSYCINSQQIQFTSEVSISSFQQISHQKNTHADCENKVCDKFEDKNKDLQKSIEISININQKNNKLNQAIVLRERQSQKKFKDNQSIHINYLTETFKINRLYFHSIKHSKQLRYIELMKIFKKYQDQVEVYQQAQYDTQINILMHFNFHRIESQKNFGQQISILNLYITKDGQIKQRFEQKKIYLSNNGQFLQIQNLSWLKSLKNGNEMSKETIKEATQLLRNWGIWHFFTLWQNGFKQKIENFIENGEMYIQLFQEYIKFAIVLDYLIEQLKLQTIIFNKKIETSLSKVKKNIKNQEDKHVNSSFYFYDIIFKEMYDQIDRLINLLGIKKLQDYFNKGKSQKHKKQQRQTFELSLDQVYYKEKILEDLKKQLDIKQEKEYQNVIYSYILHRITVGNYSPFVMKINNTKKLFSQYLNEQLGEQRDQKLKIISLKKIIPSINTYLKSLQMQLNPKQNNKKPQQNETYQSLLSFIEEQRLIETKCLGCATFFNVQVNILDQTVNSVPLKVFPSVGQMKQYETQIKDNICALLNSGGGVILFDCILINEKVVVKGAKISEKNKEEYEQRFTSYLDTFEPKDNLKKCVTISFVPLVSEKFKIQNKKIIQEPYNGEDSILKPNQSYRLRPYLQNMYVMRVRICPADGQKVYFWNQNNDKEQKAANKSFLCTQLVGDTIKSIRLGRISKLIKQKIKKHYIPEKQGKNTRLFIAKPTNCFGHQCRIPSAGVGCQQETSSIINSKSLVSDFVTKKFENMSLLIARQKYLPQIKRRLISEGVQCQIQQKFKSQGFQSVKHTAVIYHNKKFEELLRKILQNPKFIFEGKNLIVINITNYIKLSKRDENCIYRYQEFKKLKEWINKVFPNEQLKLYEFRPAQKIREYYLHSDSQQSTLYIYYCLNHFKEKTVFKNPLHLDKMSPEQRATKFIELYSQPEQKKSILNQIYSEEYGKKLE